MRYSLSWRKSFLIKKLYVVYVYGITKLLYTLFRWRVKRFKVLQCVGLFIIYVLLSLNAEGRDSSLWYSAAHALTLVLVTPEDSEISPS